MTNLSKRVEKAKKLNYSHSPLEPGKWGTWGSRGKDYGEKYYHINLSHKIETIKTPDKRQKKVSVFLADCQKDTGNGQLCNCPGNERHTVCYHCLGAIYRSFEEKEKLVSFFETYESAIRMSFGGKIAKVQSVNGNGFLWCVVRDWPEARENNDWHGAQQESIKEQGILSASENINLMRGENDEGID
jgi:hypothetical protein